MKFLIKLIIFGVFTVVGAGTSLAQVAGDGVGQEVVRAGLSDLELPVSLMENIQKYREEQRALVEERRQLTEFLRTATEKSREFAIATFKKENEGRLAVQRALAEHVREGLKEVRAVRPERPSDRPAPERPELQEDVQEILRDFTLVRQSLMNERREVLETLKDASKEEREAGILAMRAAQWEQIEAQRELAEQVREGFKDLREERRSGK